MFETLRRHPFLVLNQATRDPLDALAALREKLYGRMEATYTGGYTADPNWEEALRRHLRITSGSVVDDFWQLWFEVVESLRSQWMGAGPFSSRGRDDGDAGFVRAIWCLIRHLRPINVVETGVAHGITSRFILEALELNAAGKLWSVDRPPVDPRTRREVGAAVYQIGVPVERWTYIAGTSRRKLPALLSRLGRVDLFIHDSVHSNRNVMFELECAWRYLIAGGVMVIGDIDASPAFDTFTKEHSEHPSFVCVAEPPSPDSRRFNQKGLFGIICKQRWAIDRRERR